MVTETLSAQRLSLTGQGLSTQISLDALLYYSLQKLPCCVKGGGLCLLDTKVPGKPIILALLKAHFTDRVQRLEGHQQV